MSSCRNERQQSETTTNWVVKWRNDAAGGTVLPACAKINSVTVFGKKYSNDNLLSVRKLKDSLLRRLSITCRATKKIKFYRYADMGRTLRISVTAIRWYSRYNGHQNGQKPQKRTQELVNEFFTNLPSKSWMSMHCNDLLPA